MLCTVFFVVWDDWNDWNDWGRFRAFQNRPPILLFVHLLGPLFIESGDVLEYNENNFYIQQNKRNLATQS